MYISLRIPNLVEAAVGKERQAKNTRVYRGVWIVHELLRCDATCF